MRSNNRVIICHGKSELLIMSYIKQAFRLPYQILAENKGKNSIQITSLLNYLNRREFKTEKGFKSAFKIKDIKTMKIFIIMDSDDCTKEEFERFKDKSMFKSHWMYDNIVPIYNIRNLEEVIRKTSLKIYDSKSDAAKIFPIKNIPGENKSVKPVRISKEEGIKIVIEELTPVSETNMEVVMNDMYNNR